MAAGEGGDAALRVALPVSEAETTLRRRRERKLVAAAQGGSEEALEQLFRAHWPRAYRAAYLIVRDAAAAEDIAQEAFLAAVRALDRFDRGRPFGPWLARIVANRAIDHARARALRAEVADLDDDSARLAVEGPQPFAAAALSTDLHRAVAELPLEQRSCVVLRYLLDWTPGEIARFLEVPRGTVNSRLRRSLDRLASAVEEREPRSERKAGGGRPG